MTKPEDSLAFPWQRNPGMTLRDWFAGQALSGVIGSTNMSRLAAQGYEWPQLYPEFAAHAYAIADTMLVERQKE